MWIELSYVVSAVVVDVVAVDVVVVDVVVVAVHFLTSSLSVVAEASFFLLLYWSSTLVTVFLKPARP